METTVDRSKTPMVVEFVGLPGCGKSTLATQLIEHLDANGSPVSTYRALPSSTSVSLRDKLFASAASIKAFPKEALKLLWLRVVTSYPDAYGISAVLYLLRMLRYLNSEKIKEETQGFQYVVSDQLMLQATTSIAMPPRVKRSLHCISKELRWGGDVTIIYCKCPVTIAKDRIIGRTHGTSRLDSLSTPQLNMQLNELDSMILELVDCIRLRIRVITVDMTKTISENVEIIAQALTQTELKLS